MRPLHVRAALLLTPVFLFAFFAHAEDKKLAIPMKDFKGATAFKVLRTIDGDTTEIEKDGRPVDVRLIRMGTPETAHLRLAQLVEPDRP